MDLSQNSNLELENIFATLILVQNQENPDYNKPLETELNKIPHQEIAVSPNNPPWNSGIAFLFLVASVLFIVIVPSVLIIPYIISQGINFSDKEQLQKVTTSDPTALMIAVGGTLIAHILTLAIGWIIVTKFKKHPFLKTLGWNWGGFKFWHGFVLLIGIFATALILSSILGTADNEVMKILRSSRSVVILFAFLATFSAPFVEELVYRGVLYSAFQRTFSKGIAVVFVTAVFGLVHVWQYYPDFTAILTIMLMSLILTLIRMKTDNLLPCFVFHTVINGLQSLALVLAPYLPKEIDPTAPTNTFLGF